MPRYRVSERTSIDDVISWRLQEPSTFRVGRRSGFEPGAQGLALSVLAGAGSESGPISVECDFDEPTSIEELGLTILASAFGFAAVRLAKTITFNGTSATKGFKPLLSSLYKSTGGVLGSGSSRSVVCPDPVFSLPPALAAAGEKSSPDFFPPPSSFTLLLNTIVKDMGFRRLLASNEESSVVSFVYEALRNSLEHGYGAVETSRRVRSTRALIAEKLVIQAGDLSQRHLSRELKEYLSRIAEANRGDLGLGVICLTVADQGNGIQTTLPAKAENPDESPQERFARAFAPGQSRKPAGVVKRGLGLSSVVSAAHHLQALIRITSGSLSVGQDFSTGENKYPTLNFEETRVLPEGFAGGTSISIFFPEFAFDLDQTSLFKR